MKGKKWPWIVGGGLALLLTAGLVAQKVRADNGEAALREQLRLARAEGIPVTAAEYKATIRTAKPEENAASFYRQLHVPYVRSAGSKSVADLQDVAQDLLFNPGPETLAEAEARLKAKAGHLKLLDQAVLRPRCWFDRDWSEGLATLFPELADMKNAGKLLCLRGSVAASQGDSKTAIAEVRKVFIIANHAGEEPNLLSRLVQDSIYLIGLRTLGLWAFTHPNQPEYRAALGTAIKELPRSNLQEEHSDDLFSTLAILDLSTTVQGRRTLGLREEDVPKIEKLAPYMMDRTQAKAQIVKAKRDYIAALKRPPSERSILVTKANQDLMLGMMAFPTGAHMYDALSASDDDITLTREAVWLARKQQYMALLRALSAGPVPRKIKTTDLPSPFDKKPLIYSYDGKQMVLEVSGTKGSITAPLKIPSDRIVMAMLKKGKAVRSLSGN